MTQIRYDLDYLKTLPFFKSRLDDINILSRDIVKQIVPDNGSFFTVLPEGSNLDRLYEFEAGVVAPQNPNLHYDDPLKGTYSWTPSNEHEIARLLTNMLNSDKLNLTCIIDNVLRTANSRPITEVECAQRIYNNEVYYVVSQKNVSERLICDCLRYSEAFWHSLGVVTVAEVPNVLSEEALQMVCNQAVLAFVSAYDAESYVFWERNRGSFDIESFLNEP